MYNIFNGQWEILLISLQVYFTLYMLFLINLRNMHTYV